MNSCRIRILITSLCFLAAQPAVAQGSKYGASVRGEMHVPTEAECIDALAAGNVLGPSGDGRVVVAKGDIVYWIAVTPTYIECDAAKFSPKSE